MSGPTVFASGMTCEQGRDYISPTDWQTYTRIAATGIENTDPALEAGPVFKFLARTYQRITSIQLLSAGIASSISNNYPDVTFNALAANAANNRVRAVYLTGRGTLQFLALGLQMQITNPVRIEIICDGRAIADSSPTLITSGTYTAIGSPSAASADNPPIYRGAINDPVGIPFQRVLEVWLTTSASWFATVNTGFKLRVRGDA